MARSLGYTPPAPPSDQARDELDDLVAALHDSGLLRALAGGVRTYPQLLGALLDVVDARTVRSVIALASALGDLDPDGSARLASGVRRARTDAAATLAGPPEKVRTVVRRLRDPDTRRGLSAALAALSAIGGALADDARAPRPHM